MTEASGPVKSAAGRETRYSFCRNCVANCGVEFEVADGRILSHRPDRQNPNSDGFFCIKGDFAIDLVAGREERLTSALRRANNGEFEAIAPDVAMSDVAERLKAVIDAHGPQAVALYFGTAVYGRALTLPMAKSFIAAIGAWKIFSTMTIDQSARWVAYGRMGVFVTGKPNIADTDVLLMSGTNPVISKIPNYGALPASNQSKHIKAMQDRGGKLIIIDPRRTETARLADIHLQPRPGFDADIFACLIRIVLENDWHDKPFCDRYVAGLDRLRAAVEPFTPELVARRAGVDPEMLREIARIVSHSRKPLCEYGTGTTMSHYGDTAAQMIEALNAIVGGFVRAGDKVRHPGVFSPKATVEGVAPPFRSWEHGPKLRSGHGRFYGEYPTSRLADEMTLEGPEKIRALIVLGANPLATWGEPEAARQAMKDLDLLVVIDPRLTETAQVADYVIAPALQYEVDDINMICDLLMYKPFVQMTQPVVPPPAGAIEDWAFFNGVANRMGLTLTAKPFDLARDYADIDGGIELTPGRDWTSRDLLDWYARAAGLDPTDLAARLHGYEPDMPIPTVSAPAEDDGARMDLCAPDVQDEMKRIAGDDRADTAPYRLVNRRILESHNTAFRMNAVTRRRHPTNRLYVNPADLAREGWEEGTGVTIRGEHGQVSAYVKADATMRPGVVSITHGWGAISEEEDPGGTRGAHLGRLVSMRPDHVQKHDGMPLQSSIPVHVVPMQPAGTR